MKVYCPIQNCKWETTFSTEGLDNHAIYAKAKAEINNHKRNSSKCERHYCACAQSYSTLKGLQNHLTHKRNNTDDHFELSYCSIVSTNNHRILNVETNEKHQNISISVIFANQNMLSMVPLLEPMHIIHLLMPFQNY